MRAVAAVLLLGAAAPAAAQSYCGNSYTGCRPAGERMYSAYPNSPVMGKEFSLLIVGCNMQATAGSSVNRDYVIVPSAIPCSDVNVDAIPVPCKMNGDNMDTTKAIKADCKNTGWLCSNCAKVAHAENDMSTTAITKIVYGAQAAEADAGGEMAPLTLCRQSIGYNSAGNKTIVWTALPTHDRQVSERSDEMALAFDTYEVRGAADINAAAGLEEEKKGNCCEGLKLGDACIPLIVFILLWLLMAAALAALAYMCHKNQQDIDMERNNLQFSNFGADKELQDFAAEQGGEDDDDI